MLQPRNLHPLMVGREVMLTVNKKPAALGDVVIEVEHITVLDDRSQKAVNDVSFEFEAERFWPLPEFRERPNRTRRILAWAEKPLGSKAKVNLNGKEITKKSVREVLKVASGLFLKIARPMAWFPSLRLLKI